MKNNFGKILALTILFVSVFCATDLYAIYGVDYGEGYFDGHHMCVRSKAASAKIDNCSHGSINDSDFYVLPKNSLDGVNSADKLYNLLKGYNDDNKNKSRKRTGSGFIVNTMMGKDSAGEGRNISDETWIDLKARLRSMDAKGQITWDGDYSYCDVSSFYTKYYYKDGKKEDNYDVAFYEVDECQTDSAIRFYDEDKNIIYVLSRVCGNPVGGFKELPEADKWKVSVTSKIKNKSSLPLTVGSTVSWEHTVKNDGPDETDVNVSYRYEDGGVLGSGSGSDNEFSKGADEGDDESFNSTSRAITQDDVGGQMCRATSAKPKSWESDDRIPSGNDCVTIPYNYSLLPAITTSIAGGTVEADVRISVYPTNTNEIIANPTKSKDTQWRVTEIIFDKGTDVPAVLLNDSTYSDGEPCPNGIYFNPNAGCRNITNVDDKTGNTVFTENGSWRSGDVLTTNVVIGGHDVGTKVCYAFSVQPNKSAIGLGDDNRWRHSKLNCLIVGKKPKVQILGGDLLSGGLIQTSISKKNISGTTRMFGSWDEYAALAAGSISGMGSGAAFAGPGLASQNVCDYSKLSFNNVGCSLATPVLGNYSMPNSMPDVAASFPDNRSAFFDNNIVANDLVKDLAKGLYVRYHDGDLALTQSELQPGKSLVLKVNGSVTILGNQTYNLDNNGSNYKSATQLPQLLIIADNINIADTVTNIDAWLIAKNGYINTCSSNRGASLSTSASLSAGICDRRLTVNGPVFTGKLYLRRTAGSGTGLDHSGDPAEVFNLRADAYLWAAARAGSNGQVYTIKTIELPPRL